MMAKGKAETVNHYKALSRKGKTMRQILKREYNLPRGSIIYREKSDCSYWKIVEYNNNYGCYGATQLDENGNLTDQIGFFTPQDLIGDYVEV